MLDDPDIDAIDIITPTDTHKFYALEAIASGRSVLCEKPLALNAPDCQEMLDAAKNAGVIHAVNFNQRGRTPVGRMSSYIADGYVGDVYHINIRWECQCSKMSAQMLAHGDSCQSMAAVLSMN